MDKSIISRLYGSSKGSVNQIRMKNPYIKSYYKHLKRQDKVEKTTIKNWLSQLGTSLEAIAIYKENKIIDKDFIDSITQEDIEIYWNTLLENKVKPGKRKIKLIVLKDFFDNFLDKKWDLGKGYKVKMEKKILLTMEPDEVPKFFNAIWEEDNDHIGDKIFFSLLVGSGLRREEAKLLFQNNINEKQKFVHIRITDLHTPKERKERNTILSNETLRLIKKYQRPKPANAKWKPLLVLNKQGLPLSMSTMRSRFLRYCKKAGIRTNLGMHKLRGTFSDLMAREGYTIEQVHIMMGHDDLRTTEKYYLNLREHLSIANVKSPLDAIFGTFESSPITNK